MAYETRPGDRLGDSCTAEKGCWKQLLRGPRGRGRALRRAVPRPRAFPRASSLRTSLSMAGASQGFHEDESRLSSRTKDLHRAIVSLQEELEAVDWYQQRADAAEDPELREILEHNRDEEKEHAMMLLEWIRRKDVVFARMMRLHTGHGGPIVSEEESGEAAGELDVEGRAEKAEKGARR